jgi:hypothetical protein
MDVLSKNNSFSIRTRAPHHEYSLTILAPHIQRLELFVCTAVPDWKWLATLARGGLSSFEGLRDIKVTLLIVNDHCVKHHAYWTTLSATGILAWDVDILNVRFRHRYGMFTSDEVAALEKRIGYYLQRRKDVQT